MSLMGQRQYAAHRKAAGLVGGTHHAVQKAIAAGRIAANDQGRIDSDVADLAWATTTDQAMQRRVAAPKPAAAAPKPEPAPAVLPILDGVLEQASAMTRPEWPEWPDWKPAPPTATVGSAPLPAPSIIDLQSFQVARTRREWAEAQKAEDELAQSRGKLIDAGEARRAFHAIGKMHAQVRETVPAQLAPLLVGLSDLREIEKRIRDAFQDADRRVADEILSRYSDLAASGSRDAVAS